MKNIVFAIILFILIIGAILLLNNSLKPENKITNSPASSIEITDNTTHFSEPIANALSRITKKPFGLFVSPNDSPISPEKFAGYHTGVDFETTVEEANLDIPVYAICDGQLIEKKFVNGYGGVAIQECTLLGEPITIIYGHLKLTSIFLNVNTQVTGGEKIGILGKEYSNETDGERKHLHLGIHKGLPINYKGYVQNQSELNSWLSFVDF